MRGKSSWQTCTFASMNSSCMCTISAISGNTRCGSRNGLEIKTSRSYPVCVGGQWAGPPEDCGGPQAFLDRRVSALWRVRELLDDLLEDIKVGDTEALYYRREELQPWREWIMLHRFDRRRVNRRLITPDFTASGRTAIATSTSRGGPQTCGPASCIAVAHALQALRCVRKSETTGCRRFGRLFVPNDVRVNGRCSTALGRKEPATGCPVECETPGFGCLSIK